MLFLALGLLYVNASDGFPLGPVGHAILARRSSPKADRYAYNDRPVCDKSIKQTGQGCRLWEHKPLKFAGGLLGVRAKLLLYPDQKRAIVELKGAPIGGAIYGVAWFKRDGMSVELDPDFARALKRRFVVIQAAGAEAGYTEVWVRVKLPLALGQHTIRLRPVAA